MKQKQQFSAISSIDCMKEFSAPRIIADNQCSLALNGTIQWSLWPANKNAINDRLSCL